MKEEVGEDCEESEEEEVEVVEVKVTKKNSGHGNTVPKVQSRSDPLNLFLLLML
jgi:hypothetical protein